ncbi:major facilitator superfamily domain-containing protein [Pisolithus marmoratus]|nr:major facilitator superfamily domain-containing protein [Pisolithus marmoratus]
MYGDGTGSGTSISSVHFALLITCSLLTGLGANAGVTAAVNTVAKSFPESARATTTGLVLSSLGLSAFCFSTIAQIFFPGDTSALLLLLSLATSIPPLLAVFIVRPVPLPPIGPGPEGDQTRHYERIPNGEVVPFIADCSASVEEDDRPLEIGYAGGPLRPDILLDIHGKMLFRALDFYLLFTITLLCIMYINNVGAISRALIAKSNPKYDETEASKQQVAQVSTLSIGNFAGRILIGLSSDFSHSYFRLPRGYYLCFVSLLFILSQTFAIGVSDISTLRMATAILGLAYGSLIGTLPVIIIDWFGLAHLSENMGYVCLALLVGGNFFSIIFGRNLDAHVPREDTNMFLGVTRATNAVSVAAMRDILSERQCLLGRECYVSSLKVTLVACMAALALSAWAALRDEDRKRLRKGMVDGYDEGVSI